MSNRQNSRSVPTATRLSVGILLAGAIAAMLISMGGLWASRVGIVIATFAGLAVLVLARARARKERHRHGEQLVKVSREQRAYVSEMRTRHRVVVQSLIETNFAAQESVEALTRRVGGLGAEVSTLRGDQAAKSTLLAERDAAVETLRARLADAQLRLEARGALLAGLDIETRAALELARPATSLAGPADLDLLGSERDNAGSKDEFFSDEDHPTVVELRLRSDTDSKAPVRRRA